MIVATCGHSVDHICHLCDCTIAEYDRKNQRCISYCSYCKHCYDHAEKQGLVLHDEGEENKWLGGRSITIEFNKLLIKFGQNNIYLQKQNEKQSNDKT